MELAGKEYNAAELLKKGTNTMSNIYLYRDNFFVAGQQF